MLSKTVEIVFPYVSFSTITYSVFCESYIFLAKNKKKLNVLGKVSVCADNIPGYFKWHYRSETSSYIFRQTDIQYYLHF